MRQKRMKPSGFLLVGLFILVLLGGQGCASPYQQYLIERHMESVDFTIGAARENHCLTREGNKAVVASKQAVAFGGTPKDYANPSHLSRCEYLGR